MFLAACNNDFDPASLVTGFRVLAIKAEPPELSPGQTSTLTVLTAGPRPDGVTFHWDWCKLPAQAGQSGTVNADCAKNQFADFIVPVGDGEPLTFTMPSVDPQSGALGFPDSTLGLYLPVRLWVSFPGKPADLNQNPIISFYRVRLHIPQNPSPPNHNPTLTGIFQEIGPDGGISEMPVASGMPGSDVMASDKVTLRTYVTPGSDEMYLASNGDPRSMDFVPTTEIPRFFWYTTVGVWDHDITGEDRPDAILDLTPSSKHPATKDQTYDLWVVVRDDRGGVSWQHGLIVAR